MDEYRVARRLLMVEVNGGRVWGRPRLVWMDGVKMALGSRMMPVEAGCQIARKIGVEKADAYVDD